jgi:hypothetical protein
VITEVDREEYLDEIRKQVCSICVERPPGGPPCHPLGKECGVELHLPQLIDAVREVHSSRIAPYLEHNRLKICGKCAYHHSSICPCPMDYLAVPLVQAVEAVDERRARHERERGLIASLLRSGSGDLEDVVESFAEAAGRWTGCDWPTRFGKSGLDLNGCTPATAKVRAAVAATAEQADEWRSAASWLEWLESMAEDAEMHAFHAVEAAKSGAWSKAVEHARWARALEFACGRTLRRDGQLTWGPFCKTVEGAAGAGSWCAGCA